ncbi:MAG TPA: hypothetical protein DIT97_03790 [Gimesia maris]|uniref:Uncharacterized protein n=1 Tax=Gimesia maris TaxID=122 RepID=A0A3D3R2J9_9PLAN|nr:hypothetical protein [Gimesia maris]
MFGRGLLRVRSGLLTDESSVFALAFFRSVNPEVMVTAINNDACLARWFVETIRGDFFGCQSDAPSA